MVRKKGMILHHGDCLDILPTIPDGSVDLTVTSPPYDNLRTYNGNNDSWSDDVWKAVLAELYRVTKQGGVVVWIVGDATIEGSETGTSFRQALHAMDCGYRLHDTMIWEKSTFSVPIPNRYHAIFEYMFVFSKGTPTIGGLIHDKRNKHAGKSVAVTVRESDGSIHPRVNKTVSEYGRRSNIWKVTEVKNNRGGHPAPFPQSLAHDHIISWSNESATVLDPFMGSGTTGVAAVNTRREFIGIELDEGYYNIAKERIENVVVQKELMSYNI